MWIKDRGVASVESTALKPQEAGLSFGLWSTTMQEEVACGSEARTFITIFYKEIYLWRENK